MHCVTLYNTGLHCHTLHCTVLLNRIKPDTAMYCPTPGLYGPTSVVVPYTLHYNVLSNPKNTAQLYKILPYTIQYCPTLPLQLN